MWSKERLRDWQEKMANLQMKQALRSCGGSSTHFTPVNTLGKLTYKMQFFLPKCTAICSLISHNPKSSYESNSCDKNQYIQVAKTLKACTNSTLFYCLSNVQMYMYSMFMVNIMVTLISNKKRPHAVVDPDLELTGGWGESWLTCPVGHFPFSYFFFVLPKIHVRGGGGGGCVWCTYCVEDVAMKYRSAVQWISMKESPK